MKPKLDNFACVTIGILPAILVLVIPWHFRNFIQGTLSPWSLAPFELGLFALVVYAFGQYVRAIIEIYLRPARAREQELTKQLKDAEAREENALQLAGTDPLTGLLNRRGASLMLQGIFGAQRRFAHQDSDGEASLSNLMQLAVAVIDLDGFKAANDQFGHIFGDATLCLVAELLRRQFARDTDIVCRSGGDEFQVFILGEKGSTTIDAVSAQLASFCQLFESECQGLFVSTCPTTRQPLVVTASCGVTIGNLTNNQDIDETLLARLLASADQAMYDAKRAGKNQVVTSQAD